jgi:hypothetical protein
MTSFVKLKSTPPAPPLSQIRYGAAALSDSLTEIAHPFVRAGRDPSVLPRPCCAPRWALIPQWGPAKTLAAGSGHCTVSFDWARRSHLPLVSLPKASSKSSCPIVHFPRNSRSGSILTRIAFMVLLILHPNSSHISVQCRDCSLQPCCAPEVEF